MLPLTAELVERYAYSGGTFLHSSRTRPSAVPAKDVPAHLKDKYTAEKNDLTDEVIANLEFLGIDYLVPAGGDDTLSYGVELGRRGFPVVAIPKTMDNDVPGTDYCMGFGTCVNRTIEMARQVTSSAASHERIVVLEVFGRYAGFTALLPTFAGAADRCLIPEHEFDVERSPSCSSPTATAGPRATRSASSARAPCRPAARWSSWAARRTCSATPSSAASASA